MTNCEHFEQKALFSWNIFIYLKVVKLGRGGTQSHVSPDIFPKSQSQLKSQFDLVSKIQMNKKIVIYRLNKQI